jgi:beta-glucanase (GH16 family)
MAFTRRLLVGPLVAVTVALTASSSSGAGSPSPELDGLSHWQLVFADDFSGDILDGAKWSTSYPWGSTADWTPSLDYRAYNVIVRTGSVKLRALHDSLDGRPYSSGMLCSAGKFAFRYGYVEARAKIPAGRGLWPAFWLLPASGDWPPEIDVMENIGSSPNIQHMHYHYVDRLGATRDSGGSWVGPDLSTDFHTYAVEWSPAAIRWYVDGTERRSSYAEPSTIASEPMYLIANMQIGGTWPGDPDASTPFPSEFKIDYVRVWQPTGAAP